MSIFPPDLARALQVALWQSVNDGYSVKCACLNTHGVGIVVTNLATVALAFLPNVTLVTQLQAVIANFRIDAREAQRLVMQGLCGGPQWTQVIVDTSPAKRLRLRVTVSVPLALPSSKPIAAQVNLDLVHVKDAPGAPPSADAALADGLREHVVVPMAQMMEVYAQLTEGLASYLPAGRTVGDVLDCLPKSGMKDRLASTPSVVTGMIAEYQVRRLQAEQQAAAVAAAAGSAPGAGGGAGSAVGERRSRDDGPGTGGLATGPIAPPQPPAAAVPAAKDPNAEKLKKIKRAFR
jgi:hypothetical protein